MLSTELEGHALRYRSITFLDRCLWVTFSGNGGSRAQLPTELRRSCTQVSKYHVLRYFRVTFSGSGWSHAQLSERHGLKYRTALEGHILRYPSVTFSDT